jgi:lysophospholipase L1-like esterase
VTENQLRQPPRFLDFRWIVFVGCGLAIRCGGNPARPSTPTPADPPKITCPTSSIVPSLDGGPTLVTYAAASVAGGELPVLTACTPGSGSAFAVGATPVTCTATDALQRVDRCSFTVTVQPPPRITATRFVAFGDSITAGVVASGSQTLVWRREVAYPLTLQGLLALRYTAQTIVVADEGLAGERIGDGQRRLPQVLARDTPEVLLVLEGINDLNGGGAAVVPTVVSGLDAMVREGRSRRVRVFVATLLPQRPGGSRAGAVTVIPIANDQIRAMAASEGAPLVDLYQGFGGEAGMLIGDDGLHPNAAGYQKIAEIFFAAIRNELEVRESAMARPSARW